MFIKKILNNNVVVTEGENGKEVIVMGIGIGFKTKKGDFVKTEKIDKIFTLHDSSISKKLETIMAEIPFEYLEVTEEIINYAKSKLDRKINDSIYISLTDHIYNAVERYRDGVVMKTPLMWDAKHFYKTEYEISLVALETINRKLNLSMDKDEATFITLHLVNAGMNEEMSFILDVTQVMQEITDIVKNHFKIEFNEESLVYFRFITHLKFFAQRLLKKFDYEDDTDPDLLDIIKANYKEAYECTQKIKEFIENNYHYILVNEELLYLTIHINKIIKKINN